MTGFMGPPLLKGIYKTLLVVRLHFLLTYVLEYIKYFKE
jgi:hypothetical protein